MLPHAVRMPASIRGSAVTLMAGLALLWGSNFLWIKLGIRAMSPVELTVRELADRRAARRR